MRSAPVFLALFLLALLAGCRKAPQAVAPGPAPINHTEAPDFLLPDVLSGDVVQLSELRGKVVLLDFWATWCPPCRGEIPGLIELQKTYGSKGLQIVGVSIDQGGVETVKPFAREWKINYKIVLDHGHLAEQYGKVDEIPATFLIGKDGKIVKQYIGFHEKEVFEKDILAALSQGKHGEGS